MSDAELLGKHTRLRKELSVAYAEPFWDTVHIKRITSELAAIERLLASRKLSQRWAIVRRQPGVGN